MPRTTERLLLLDTASLYFRAFHGMPDTITGPDGRPVNAVRGLLDFIAKFVTEYEPTHIACCWDNDWRPAWRVELLPSYKAHRVDNTVTTSVVGAGGKGAESGQAEEAPDDLSHQVPIILDTLLALGIHVVGKDGYEADDVIGTLATNASMPVDVVTGDRDLFQLVDDERAVRLLYVARGISKHERADNAWVQAKYGINGSQYVDFATLRGDPSDGLPGVAGVGEKTAASLINSYGSLTDILTVASRADSPVSAGVRNKLAAAVDYLAVAPEVVAVARELDLGVCAADLWLPKEPADPRRWAELVEAHGLGSSAERIVTALAR
ncbi:5'-3' exonuclease [Propionibacteriaceae bacterium Y1685]